MWFYLLHKSSLRGWIVDRSLRAAIGATWRLNKIISKFFADPARQPNRALYKATLFGRAVIYHAGLLSLSQGQRIEAYVERP